MYGSNNRLYDPPVIRYEIDENIRIWHQGGDGGGGDDQEAEPVAASGGQACVPPPPTTQPASQTEDPAQKANRQFLANPASLGFMENSAQNAPKVTVVKPQSQDELNHIITDIHRGIYPTVGVVPATTTTPFGSSYMTTTMPFGGGDVGAGGAGSDYTTTPSVMGGSGGPGSTTAPWDGKSTADAAAAAAAAKKAAQDAAAKKAAEEAAAAAAAAQKAAQDAAAAAAAAQKGLNASGSTSTTTPNSTKSTTSAAEAAQKAAQDAEAAAAAEKAAQEAEAAAAAAAKATKNPYAYIPDTSIAAIPAFQALPYMQNTNVKNFGPKQSLPYIPPSGFKNFQPQQPMPYLPPPLRFVPPAQPMPPVNCQYSWGGWSACDQATGTKKRYAKTTNAIFGGTSCDPAHAVDTSTCPVDCIGSYTTDSCVNGDYYRTYTVTKPSINRGDICKLNDGIYEVQFQAPKPTQYSIRVDSCADCKYSLTELGCDPTVGFKRYNVTTYSPAIRKGKECVYTDGTKIANADQVFTSTGAADSCVIPCAGQYVAGSERCDNAGNLYRTYRVTTPPIHATTCSINDGTYAVTFPYTSVDQSKKIELKVGTCPVNCQGSWGDWSKCSKRCGGGTMQRSYNVSVPAVNGGTACPTSPDTKSCGTQACPTTTKLTNKVSKKQVQSVSLEQMAVGTGIVCYGHYCINETNYFNYHNILYNDNHSMSIDFTNILEKETFVMYYYCSSSYSGVINFIIDGKMTAYPITTNLDTNTCYKISVDPQGNFNMVKINISDIPIDVP